MPMEKKATEDKAIKVINAEIETIEPAKQIGRPRVYDVDDITNKLEQYIDSVDDPHLPGFCSLPGMPTRETLYEIARREEEEKGCSRLSDIIQKSKQKQEANLVDKAMNGKCNPIFAIFRLKQPAFGWKDKVETENNTKITLDIQMPDNVKRLSK